MFYFRKNKLLEARILLFVINISICCSRSDMQLSSARHPRLRKLFSRLHLHRRGHRRADLAVPIRRYYANGLECFATCLRVLREM
jgi:hypothetical protein